MSKPGPSTRQLVRDLEKEVALRKADTADVRVLESRVSDLESRLSRLVGQLGQVGVEDTP